MGKNIKKIQDMLSGNYNKPIQVGYESTTINQREEGEEWIDARGRRWIKEDGKRKQITKTDGVGFHKCGDCSKLILKQIDEDTWVRMGRCYYCQMDFECELKEKGKWKEWVHDQEKKRYEAVYQEIVEAVREANEAAALKGDRSVVNAINNARSKGQIK
tara:strand:- start:1217 stop:1693 length:477 start_codon:yes stop_codon:yes gene_type:complete